MPAAFQTFQREFGRYLRDPHHVARPPGLPARRISDTATFCFGCGAEAVAIELRDLADPDELEALATRIGDRALPLAFARVGPYLVDAGPASRSAP